jgi:hypothetical protein
MKIADKTVGNTALISGRGILYDDPAAKEVYGTTSYGPMELIGRGRLPDQAADNFATWSRFRVLSACQRSY